MQALFIVTNFYYTTESDWDLLLHFLLFVVVRMMCVSQGYTALHLASIHGHQDVVQTLINTHSESVDLCHLSTLKNPNVLLSEMQSVMFHWSWWPWWVQLCCWIFNPLFLFCHCFRCFNDNRSAHDNEREANDDANSSLRKDPNGVLKVAASHPIMRLCRRENDITINNYKWTLLNNLITLMLCLDSQRAHVIHVLCVYHSDDLKVENLLWLISSKLHFLFGNP